MNGYFLPTADLPEDFGYPPLFHRIVDLDLVHWEPWHLLGGEDLLGRHLGMATRYPDRRLVPFARRQDRDDVACWDLDKARGTVSIIDDFDAAGFEQLQVLDSFEDWLRGAFETMLRFED